MKFLQKSREFHLMFLMLVFCFFILAAPSFSLASTGSISGVVTDSNGNPIQNIEVDATSCGSGETRSSDPTGPTGNYTFGGLPAGLYKVFFYDASGKGNYVAQYYNNEPDFDRADTVSVAEGQTTANINAQMKRAGHISGVVTDSNGNPSPYSVCVDTLSCSSGYSEVGGDYTSSTGSYRIGGLLPGDYKVRFSDSPDWSEDPPYFGVYYNDKPNLKRADTISVTAGSTTTNINLIKPKPRIRLISPTKGQYLSGVARLYFSVSNVMAPLSVHPYETTDGWTGWQDLGDISVDSEDLPFAVAWDNNYWFFHAPFHGCYRWGSPLPLDTRFFSNGAHTLTFNASNLMGTSTLKRHVYFDNYPPRVKLLTKKLSLKALKTHWSVKFVLYDALTTPVRVGLRICRGSKPTFWYAAKNINARATLKGCRVSYNWNGRYNRKAVSTGKYTIEFLLRDEAGNKRVVKQALTVSK